MINTIKNSHQKSGIPVDALCAALVLPRSTYYRHQHQMIDESKKALPRLSPKNALCDAEKQKILDLLHSERFMDKTPYETFNALIDQGEYYCSTRTMYRVLESQGEVIDRRGQRNHRDAIKPELIATKPNEVWSWDITKLKSDKKWTYFYLYVILDIYSRYVVGWMIADSESKELARLLIQRTALKQEIQPEQLTLHSDNGPSMTSHTIAQLLEHLGVTKTHNRPYTSNDNPFSESQFKTLKYCPEFPGRFDNMDVAEKFSQQFFDWYNKKHYHSGIEWLTPESVHYGRANEVLNRRHETLLKAYSKNPVRFNNKPPKLKHLSPAVYINPPKVGQIHLENITNNSGEKEDILVG